MPFNIFAQSSRGGDLYQKVGCLMAPTICRIYYCVGIVLAASVDVCLSAQKLKKKLLNSD